MSMGMGGWGVGGGGGGPANVCSQIKDVRQGQSAKLC